jgi:hypothetical protein
VRELTNVPTNELAPFLDGAEEDGFVTGPALEALALEHDLDEDEVASLRAELEARGVRIDDETGNVEEPEIDLSVDVTAGGVPDSMTLFMNQIGRWPLLTAS